MHKYTFFFFLFQVFVDGARAVKHLNFKAGFINHTSLGPPTSQEVFQFRNIFNVQQRFLPRIHEQKFDDKGSLKFFPSV